MDQQPRERSRHTALSTGEAAPGWSEGASPPKRGGGSAVPGAVPGAAPSSRPSPGPDQFAGSSVRRTTRRAPSPERRHPPIEDGPDPAPVGHPRNHPFGPRRALGQESHHALSKGAN